MIIISSWLLYPVRLASPAFIFFRIQHSTNTTHTRSHYYGYYRLAWPSVRENEELMEWTFGAERTHTHTRRHINDSILNFDHSVVRELRTKKVNTPMRIAANRVVDISLGFLISNICAVSVAKEKQRAMKHWNRCNFKKKNDLWIDVQLVPIESSCKYRCPSQTVIRKLTSCGHSKWSLANYFWCVLCFEKKKITFEFSHTRKWLLCYFWRGANN